ncbi:MAG: hypothetical protein JWR50_3302 [Mucilaginibacter sp.]|nr:hypothetical protein [Mucilaginibacter sp.]
MYNDSTIKELFEQYEVNGHSIFSSELEIIEMLLGNFIHEDKIHRRILSIITKDIAS